VLLAQAAVPFTPEPRSIQWRIGFDLGNASILESPELNPGGDLSVAVREAERALPDPLLSFGLALLPFGKIATQTEQLLNPRQWTTVDLQGKTAAKVFQGMAVFMGSQMSSSEGGYHLVSVPLMPSSPFLGLRKLPSSETLIFGFAGPLKKRLQVRTKLSETRWENLLPVEVAVDLPMGYQTAKDLLGGGESADHPRFLYGTSIEASIQNRPGKLWLLNYSHPDTTIGKHPWGIFLEAPNGLQPLYILTPPKSDHDYVAYFTAAIDLNQDGSDELVIEASDRGGTAYKVISAAAGKYQEIHSSYYRGQ
jgi:hypothetical protein